MSTVRKVRQTRRRRDAGDYAGAHHDSPLARACDVIGAVRVSDACRADIAHRVSTRDLRRAYALGVVSASDGSAPDVHQSASGLWPDLSPADYLAEWIITASAWSVTGGTAQSATRAADDDDARADQVGRWAAELVTVAPAWWQEWAGRTVHPPKFAYLVELGAAEWLGASVPPAPVAEWATKVGRQWASRVRKGGTVEVPPAPVVEQW